MAVFAFIPLLWVSLSGPYGSGFSLHEKKMKREVFSSLEAPVLYYALLLFNIFMVVFSKEGWTNVIGLATAGSMFFFLYRISPNIYAWHYLMKIVHSTMSAAGNTECSDQMMNNVEAGLRRQAKNIRLCDTSPGSVIFEHTVWLATQTGFWKGERRSLFAER